MINNPGHKQAMRRYLLGQMSQDERVEIEKQYLANGAVFEELMAVEDELIGSYLSGSSAELERRELELHIRRNPEWRESVEFARAHMGRLLVETMSVPREAEVRTLHHSQSSTKDFPPAVASRPFGRTAWSYAQPAIWLVLVAVAFCALAGNLYLHHKLNEQRAEQNGLRQQLEALRSETTELRKELQRTSQMAENQVQPAVSPPSSQGRIVAFTLTSDLVRQGGSHEQLLILHGATTVKLGLALKEDLYPSYATTLRTPEGVDVWQKSGLNSQRLDGGKRGLVVSFPSAQLMRGTYIVKLFGIDRTGQETDLPSYAFHVDR